MSHLLLRPRLVLEIWLWKEHKTTVIRYWKWHYTDKKCKLFRNWYKFIKHIVCINDSVMDDRMQDSAPASEYKDEQTIQRLHFWSG